MRLGDFLNAKADGYTPAPVHAVEFKVIARGGHGEESIVEARAVLAFVDEAKRAQALHAAEVVMRRLYPDGNPPPEQRSNEQAYQLLVLALRDTDDPRIHFAESVEQLKAALVQRTATQLYTEYLDFVEDEFPEIITPEELAALVEEAKKKLARRPSHLYRLLDAPSGAAWFGRSLREVPDADVYRYKACMIAAHRMLASARRPAIDGDDEE